MNNFLETRGLLAKLLATENLIVTHSGSADTASFNTETRELTLPVLRTTDEHVYNMFVAHECSHALYTPTTWREDIPKKVPFDFVNVVEDVRIEKLIQNKFPGLRTDFSKGYDKLQETDFFGIVDSDKSKLSFIDRINLHFKLGARAFMPFSTEEREYVDMVDNCETYTDVCEAAEAIAKFVNSKATDKTEAPTNSQQGESKDGEQQTSQMKGDEGEQGDAEPDEGEGEQEDLGTGTEPTDENVSQTQKKADEALKELAKYNYNSYTYVKTPTEGLDFIVGIDELRESYIVPEGCSEYIHYERKYFNDFLASIKSDVNFMVQQFEMKKSADAYSRTQTHRTGELDMNQLHNYKLTEDIFLRQSTTPDGKNHGLIMYLDWSGSMSNVLHDTVKQILMLVQFCRKVQLPFEVYSFTSGNRNGDGRDEYKPEYNGRVILRGAVNMVQLLASTAKRSDLEQDMFHLWCESRGRYLRSDHMMMGGTPLDNALFALPQLVARFRANTAAQKVSIVCLTDGESSPVSYWETRTSQYDGESYVRPSSAWNSTTMIRHGSKVFPVEFNRASSGSIAKWLESVIDDVSITNIYLGSKAACSHYVSNYGETIDTKQFDKTRSAVVTTTNGWPVITLLHPKGFGSGSSELQVDEGESKAKIRSALKKMLQAKSTNKVVLTALVDQFS